VALRVEAAGADFAGAALLVEVRAEPLLVAVVAEWVARAGAVELLNTAWLPVRVTPAVEPLARVGAGA
jgi:hypothetical protein